MKNGELKIEKGVAIPAGGRAKGAIGIALSSMKKGDSVLLPVKYDAAYQSARRYFGPRNFICRCEEKGVRVWRTK